MSILKLIRKTPRTGTLLHPEEEMVIIKDRPKNVKGKWVRIFTDKKILRTLSEELKTTSMIAKQLGCGSRIVRVRLNDLYEQGKVKRLVVGKAYLWAVEDSDGGKGGV